jgi:hypothetical protein
MEHATTKTKAVEERLTAEIKVLRETVQELSSKLAAATIATGQPGSNVSATLGSVQPAVPPSLGMLEKAGSSHHKRVRDQNNDDEEERAPKRISAPAT